MRAVLCLGNPGPEYAHTRHNAGYLVAEYLAAKRDIQLRRRRLRSLFGRGKIGEHDTLIVQPQTFMNDSGDAARRVVQFFKIQQPDLIVVYDDIALDLGVIRLRRDGSDGGHKGIRSIAQHLGTTEIARLRMGVGQSPERMSSRDWVLSDFRASERSAVEEMVATSAAAVECWLDEGIDAAMNKFNS